MLHHIDLGVFMDLNLKIFSNGQNNFSQVQEGGKIPDEGISFIFLFENYLNLAFLAVHADW